MSPPGREVRPTSDRVREALFNILRGRVEAARVLDLFAGMGSLGLEALSRGAAFAVFVEKHGRALDVIRRNVEILGFGDRVRRVKADVLARPARLHDLGGPFEVVFIDPPYRLTETVEPEAKVGVLLETLWSDAVVAPDGIAVLEHDRRAKITETWKGFSVSDRRTYGDTSLTFMRGRGSG